MRRGEVRWARLSPVEGHEQAGHRPVLIISENRSNQARNLAIVFPLTLSERYQRPFGVELPSLAPTRSFALPGQIRTLAVTRIGKLIATVSDLEIDLCIEAMLWICAKKPMQKADNDG